MAKIKLDLPFVKSVKPTDKIEMYFDIAMPRFALRVFPSGNKSFVIKYRNKYGQQRLFTVGTFPTLTLEKARKKAHGLLEQVEHDQDPAEQKHGDKNTMTVSQLCDLYKERGFGDKKPSTVMNDISRIEHHIKPLIGNRPISTITYGMVEDMMQDIQKGHKIAISKKGDKLRSKIVIRGGREAATRTTQLLGAIFQFAVRRGLMDSNPAYGIKKPAGVVKDAHLTLADLRILGTVLNMPEIQAKYKTAVSAIKLLALTGCRRSEILTLKWEYVDFEHQTFHFPDTKTGKQDRPFGVAALRLLNHMDRDTNSEWVFPSTVDNSKHLTGLLRIFKSIQETKDQDQRQIFTKPDIGLHTLRHSFATIAHDELGYSDLTIAGLLGHQVIKNTTNRYTHLIDASQISAANKVSLLISAALENAEPAAKVIPFEKRA